MARVEVYPGHGSLFRRVAQEGNKHFYGGKGSSPYSRPPEWPKANPRGLYEVNKGEIYIPGDKFPEGITPANAIEIISLTNIINLCLITKSPQENGHYQKFQTRWREANNKRFQDLWQHALNRCHH